jgi:hypothetical protein
MVGRARLVPVGVGVVDSPSAAKRPSGRAPGSFSGIELDWLEDALKHLITGTTRRLDRFDDSVGVGVFQKAARMRTVAAADAKRRAAHAEEVERTRAERLNIALALATMAVVDNEVVE